MKLSDGEDENGVVGRMKWSGGEDETEWWGG